MDAEVGASSAPSRAGFERRCARSSARACFVIAHGGRALIGDEMGLGKTVQAIAAATAFRESFPILIIVPAVVKLNWAEELETWLDELEPGSIHVVRGRADTQAWRQPRVKCVIATFGLVTTTSAVARAVPNRIRIRHCLLVTLPEDATAARTQLIVPILKRASHAVLLSGTPALARPVELYPQITGSARPQTQIFSVLRSPHSQSCCAARRGRFGWDVLAAPTLKSCPTS